jgi:hypothetical protein
VVEVLGLTRSAVKTGRNPPGPTGFIPVPPAPSTPDCVAQPRADRKYYIHSLQKVFTHLDFSHVVVVTDRF